MTSVSQN